MTMPAANSANMYSVYGWAWVGMDVYGRVRVNMHVCLIMYERTVAAVMQSRM